MSIIPNVEINTILTNSFKRKVNDSPRPGDLLVWEEDLYQFREHRPKVGWVKVCCVQQPNLEDKDAIVWDVGETMIVADQPNLLAAIISIATHDPRSSMEDLVKTILHLFRESGWVSTRGNKVNGSIGLMGEAQKWINTTDVDQVIEQLRSGTQIVEIPIEKGIRFVNPQHHTDIMVIPSLEDNDS